MTVTRFVFITGMLRSGTTLLDKLLNAHPVLTVASQPYFNLYVDAKNRFLATAPPDKSRAVPLSDQFMEEPSRRRAFQDMLSSHVLSPTELEYLRSHATGAKGQGSPELAGKLPQLGEGTFIHVWKHLHGTIAELCGKGTTAIVGSKEVLCEEFVPYLAANHVKCVLIIRDPRAVVSSLHFGEYRASVGDRYPLLFTLRKWRKSAAYVLHLRDTPNVLTLRYEDFVSSPDEKLREIADLLEVNPFPADLTESAIVDQRGAQWTSNSSFGAKSRVDSTAVSTWKAVLDPGTAGFVEFCTLPELRSLGYEPEFMRDWETDRFLQFQEDASDVRPAYLPTHALDDKNRRLELLRRSVLLGEEPADTTMREKLFLFDDVFEKLARNLPRELARSASSRQS